MTGPRHAPWRERWARQENERRGRVYQNSLAAWQRAHAEHGLPAPRPPAPATPDQAPWTARLGPGGTVAVAAGAAFLFFLAVGTALAGSDQPPAPESQPQSSPAAAPRVPTAAAERPVRSPTPAELIATSSPASEPAAAAPPVRAAGDCDAYVDSSGWCVDGAGDYDCAGGTGNGPNYVDGPVRVATPGRDPFDLDRDNDGEGCEEPAPAEPAPPPPPPPDEGTDPRFDTCRAAIAAGYGPYRQGQDPEYDWYRDADGDGIVCE